MYLSDGIIKFKQNKNYVFLTIIIYIGITCKSTNKITDHVPSVLNVPRSSYIYQNQIIIKKNYYKR